MTDPVIAYDPEHGVWLAQSLALVEAGGLAGVAIVVNRSTDGLNWSGPVVSAAADPGEDFDKNWVARDTHPTSPHYGNCYDPAGAHAWHAWRPPRPTSGWD